MAGTCGATLAKIVLIIFNIIFFCAGIVLIVVSAWILGDKNNGTFSTLRNVFGSEFLRNSAILLISMGVLMIFVTVLGFFAAIKENVIALSVYMALLVIICGGLIAGGVVAIVFKDKVLEGLENMITETLHEVYDTTNKSYYTVTGGTCFADSTNSMDKIQNIFGCCGIYSYEDYKDFNLDLNTTCNLNYSSSVRKFPVSCCDRSGIGTSPNATQQFIEANRCSMPPTKDSGCVQEITIFIEKYSPALIGIGIGFGFLQLFGIIFAVCVCQNPDLD